MRNIYLDVTDDFSLSRGDERVTSLSQELHEVISEVTSSKIKSHDGMRKSITWRKEEVSVSNLNGKMFQQRNLKTKVKN